MKKKKRVLVGMSGGVDSSVTAALLKKRGYDVIGITMQLLPKETEHDSACCNLSAISDAKRVCSKLNIPHYTINIRDDFKRHVIDYFVNDYLNGQTPNPCVECNRYIKFDALKQKADELGADYVATGHYIKRTSNATSTKFFLKKAKDPKKDQSYFLYMLTHDQLAKTLFPLGNYLKSEIRKMAQDFGLLNADKPESQEICFVTKGAYHAFIEEQLEGKALAKGPIEDAHGNVLGEHKGIHHYTIGQRRGLNLYDPTPWYVIKIDARRNKVIVGKQDDLKSSTFHVENLSLVDEEEPILGKSFDIKTRYQMVPFKAKVTAQEGNLITLTSTSPQEYITPGQSGVLYQKERVVGGGIIALIGPDSVKNA